MRTGFERAGYPLLTSMPADAASPVGLIEVYPHPALVELSGASQRLPYKESKKHKYWPSVLPTERRRLLLQEWAKIVVLLDDKISGVAAGLPTALMGAPVARLKAYEDALDAIVCAWVGISVLAGRARHFGDEDSAIWIPQLRADSPRPAIAV
jgi:predicted RNase H-like nuclease